MTNNQQPTTNNPQVTTLIPAAGRGRRMGGERKQFRRLGGRPVLVQTLRAFIRHADIDHIVVAAPPGGVARVEEMLRMAGCGVGGLTVAGGATRQASVAIALEATPETASVVLVHDAVRPFVAPETISAVITAVRAHGAAAPAVPVADTLRRVARAPGARQATEARFGETVLREDLYRMQTPQGFRRDWLKAAHAAAADADEPATDDVQLVQRLGHPVHLVEGRSRSLKLTTPEDWEVAQALWTTEGAASQA